MKTLSKRVHKKLKMNGYKKIYTINRVDSESCIVIKEKLLFSLLESCIEGETASNTAILKQRSVVSVLSNNNEKYIDINRHYT